ncbi:MAG TPA: hypothetical protein GX398_01205 [Candidatus Cloacimonetes bacterium]|jgi:hypothetical protein|nr:hypothetical protein [Candidatus Cloacimonadota bacterium]
MSTRCFLSAALALILLSLGLLSAEQTDYAASQAFADSLFYSNDLSSSILEYKRINFLSPGNPNFEQNRFRIVQSLYFLEDYQSVVRELNSDKLILSDHPQAAYFYAKSLSNMDLIDLSNQFILQNESAESSEDLRYLLMLNYLKQDKVELAGSMLESERYLFEADDYLHQRLGEYEKRRTKSMALPNVLNIVPGLGYLPLKSYQNALSTFITTGFMYLTARELYKKDLNFTGTFFVSAGVIFHLGSYVGINRYNERIKSAYRDDLIRYIEEKLP